MANISYLWHIVSQIETIAQNVEGEHYTTPLPILSGASIGKHTRHIIDAFATVAKAISENEISFDDRTRDVKTENDRNFAVERLKNLATQIDQADLKKEIILKNSFAHTNENEIILTETTIGRELIYAIEHAVHHLAIIKIGMMHSLNIPVPSDFGVAPSTLRFQAKQNH